MLHDSNHPQAFHFEKPTSEDTDREVDPRALFLTGLHECVEFTDLHQAFDAFGKIVLCRVLKDARTGRSRRVGYVNFDTEEAAQNARATLNGTPGPGGVPWDIRPATRDPMFKATVTRRVFVRFVPLHIQAEDVRIAFSQFGEIESVDVDRDQSRAARREGGPWNLAYVTYKSNRDAIEAIANAHRFISFGPQELTVKPAVSNETRELRAKYREKHGPITLKNPEGVRKEPKFGPNPMVGHSTTPAYLPQFVQPLQQVQVLASQPSVAAQQAQYVLLPNGQIAQVLTTLPQPQQQLQPIQFVQAMPQPASQPIFIQMPPSISSQPRVQTNNPSVFVSGTSPKQESAPHAAWVFAS